MAPGDLETVGRQSVAGHDEGRDIHVTMTADRKRGGCLVVDGQATLVAKRPDARRVCRKWAVVVQIGPVCNAKPASCTARWSATTSPGSGIA